MPTHFLILHPAEPKPGWPIKLVINDGESVASVLERFNAFRSPTNQIDLVWTLGGQLMDTSLVAQESIDVICMAS